jgi:hypothetical protein
MSPRICASLAFSSAAEEGPFYVLTGRDDPFWPHSLPEAVQLDLEARILRCNTSLTLQADGDYALDALVQYGRNFFEAHFEIESSSGRVDMISDEPLASTRPSAFLRHSKEAGSQPVARAAVVTRPRPRHLRSNRWTPLLRKHQGSQLPKSPRRPPYPASKQRAKRTSPACARLRRTLPN